VTNIRAIENPNLEVQDLNTYKLLCQTHDNSFSQAENEFIRNIYKPLLTGTTSFKYQGWLLRFAISLGWKRLATGLHKLSGLQPDVKALGEQALADWQGYLLNEHTDIAPYQHHLYLTKFIEDGIDLKTKIMLMSTFDSTIFTSKTGMAIGSIFPGCMFLTVVEPTGLKVWKDSEIRESGEFDDNQRIPGGTLLPMWKGYLADIKEADSKLTPKQRAKMKENWPLSGLGNLKVREKNLSIS